MRKPTQYARGKNNYLIGSWDVDKSLEVFVWLTKTFGEGFVSIFMSPDNGEGLQNAFEGEAGDAETKVVEEFVRKVVDRLDPKEYTSYSKKICEGVKCNGQDLNFSQHFMGRMGELHFVMFQVLRHQYGDFLGGSESED